MGAIGALIGGLFKSPKIRNILVVAALVASPQITKFFVLPPVLMAHAVDVANKDLPKQLDEATRLDRTSYSNGTFVYHYTLSDEVPADADVSMIKSESIAGICNSWRASFINKDIQAVEYRYMLHGNFKSFLVIPSDC
ncbi:hypothetical protein [Phyllobacterium lublinensis]|uniref:hypothetical protein n=1 Tax=Phyllobacterium lublinensis TaxID=2875708 RepID=UPI001CC90282|nr:hypothetical protein [Phyllobacterium sp. 2063]MBZ9654670.1 hypothetical protein [Phyllobacterium sp. 2063]